jgi:TolB-like protein/Flp pilus assembly protein TadD/DNA-binding winged helix-turn-helix (wHTH) protein
MIRAGTRSHCLIQAGFIQQAAARLRCGAYLVDCADHTIAPEAGGEPRHVSAQAIATFQCLAARRGQVVPATSILELWPAGVARTRDALSHAVRELRLAFDDDSARPHYIRTVRNKGYQLIAAIAAPHGIDAKGTGRWLTFNTVTTAYASFASGVTGWAATGVFPWLGLPLLVNALLTVALAATFVAGWFALIFGLMSRGYDLDVPDVIEPPLLRMLAHRWKWSAGATLVICGLFASAAYVYEAPVADGETSTVATCDLCVAVLPFAYEGTDPEYAYLSYGVADELIAVLSRLPPIQAVSRTVTFDTRLAGLDLASIAKQLRVAHIVEGRVSKQESDVLITVKLVSTATGIAVWSRKYERRLARVFDLYDDIATRVAEELQVKLSPGAREKLATMQSASDEAYTAYLQGRDLLSRPAEGDVLARASEYFKSALRSDPGFARAYAGLCETAVAQYRGTRDSVFIGEASESCRRALELDPAAPEVHLALGRLDMETGDLAGADRAISAALAANPQYYEALLRRGDLRARERRFDDAEKAYAAAIELQPGNWMAYAASGLMLCEHKHAIDQGAARMRQVIRLQPGSTKAVNNLGVCYILGGRLEEALEVFTTSSRMASTSSTLSNIGISNFYLGRYDAAVESLERAVALDELDHRLVGNLALAQSFSPAAREVAPATYRRAIELARRRLETVPNDADALMDLATYLAAIGDREAGLAAIRDAFSLVEPDGLLLYLAACAYELLGMRAEAVQAACESIALGQAARIVESDPRLAALVATADFQQCASTTTTTGRDPTSARGE